MAKTDAQVAKEQNISRQAVHDRRAQGWTQKEIEKGKRKQARKTKYSTPIADFLGMSVAEKAEKEGVTVSEIYRRYHAAREGKKLRNKE